MNVQVKEGKKNRILQVSDSYGRVMKDQEGIEGAFKKHFVEVLSSGEPTLEMIQAGTKFIKAKVSKGMNDFLTKEVTREEIKTAVFQMSPYKSPGSDGFSACFYQKYWHVVGEDVCLVVMEFMKGKGDLKSINQTLIALIPKVKEPVTVGEFRPISLCNVLYKIMTKTLANRLKIVLPDISYQQSAFIRGRLISDNILTAYELLHSMRNRQRGKEGSMAVKLDMSKAYDRVEWRYLEEVMNKLGFYDQWVQLIMRTVSTVSYSTLVNGSVGEYFEPSRGIR